MNTSGKEFKISISTGGLILTVILICLGWHGCMGAATEETKFNNNIQIVTRHWVESQPQLLLVTSSVMCIPREFGSRMPSDMTKCRALTNGNYRIPLLCNAQGCAVDHHGYDL